ncbi:hypothetical protein BC940DRAFT_298743 [Gongronella butleri]|nr:hypothetical protein BC940DRAFT_298743 [Gongronella butleri]
MPDSTTPSTLSSTTDGHPEISTTVDAELHMKEEKKVAPLAPTSYSVSSRVLASLLMVLAGCCVALQAGFNATLNLDGGRSFASLISFIVGLGCCILFFAFDLTVLKTPRPTSRLKDAPWFAWLGGILGSYYVIINVLTVPKLGAATVLSIFVCSQVISACVIDHFGLLGVAKRKYTIWRILASFGLVGCVAVITIF